MDPIVYLNGAWLKRSEARVSVLDQGILRGDGLFETIRIWKGAIPFIDEHLDRLYNGLYIAHLAPPIAKADMANVLRDMVRKNNLTEGRLRIVITRGVGDGMDPMQAEQTETRPTYFVLAEGLPPKPAAEVYEKGVAIVTVPVFIYNRIFPINIKTISYFHNMAAKRYAKEQGAFDAIFTDAQGYCSEGTTSNLFWIEDQKVYSPPLSVGALPGVTRNSLIAVLQKMELTLIEENIHKDRLKDADEIFLSSSIIGILPVTRIDTKTLGTRAGPLTTKIRTNFIAHVDRLSAESAK